MYRRRSPRRGDCPLALCCMAFGLGVLLALCGELRTALVFAAIGLVILLSASFPSAYYEKAPSRHNPLYYFEKQGVFAVLGTAVMLLVSKFNYQRLRGAGRALIYVSVIFLILVIIPVPPIGTPCFQFLADDFLPSF